MRCAGEAPQDGLVLVRHAIADPRVHGADGDALGVDGRERANRHAARGIRRRRAPLFQASAVGGPHGRHGGE
eukprot:6704399-Pyramimonas_sp.AAC.1